ncbi:MAG: ABC transporter permease, partial [Pseudomonadota bacterium]
FERRFFMIGMLGAAIGALAAILLGAGVGFWARANVATAEGEQLAAFFGDFSVPFGAYIGIALVLTAVGAVTAATTRWTVIRTLYEIDEKRADPSL